MLEFVPSQQGGFYDRRVGSQRKPYNGAPPKAVPFHVSVNPSEENGLKEVSFVKCEQVLTLSKERLIRRMGSLENERLNTVAAAIRRVLEV